VLAEVETHAAADRRDVADVSLEEVEVLSLAVPGSRNRPLAAVMCGIAAPAMRSKRNPTSPADATCVAALPRSRRATAALRVSYTRSVL